MTSFIGVVSVIATDYLPGSKGHNYVMSHVCIPALKKYYGIKDNLPTWPDKALQTGRNDNNPRWWYQHIECEENVINGKGPVFSENPPRFVPVK